MRSVEPTLSASSTTSCLTLRVDDDLAVGVLGAERRDVLGLEALVDRAVALPQQERRFLDVALVEAAEIVVRVPHPHVRLVVAHLVAGVATEVLVGEEEHLDRAGSPLANAHSRTARAFDDVQTAPPCSPTNAFSAADEFM